MTFQILQPGAGPIPGEHYLPATPDTVLWGRLPGETDEPVLTVASGATVTIDTVSHEGILEDQGKNPRAYFGRHGVARGDVLEDAVEIAWSLARDPRRDGPQVLTGPIRVAGTRPGDLLMMTVVALTPRVPYGVSRDGQGEFAEEPSRGDPHASVVVPLAESPIVPFLGTMGVAVSRSARSEAAPPRLRRITEGSVLHLPVEVEGALAYVGHPHVAQGDGEVLRAALGASLRATVRFEVMSFMSPARG